MNIHQMLVTNKRWSKFFIYFERKFSELGEFREFNKSLKHELDQFEDPVCYLCLAGTVVTFWYPTQEVHVQIILLSLNLGKHLGKTQVCATDTIILGTYGGTQKREKLSTSRIIQIIVLNCGLYGIYNVPVLHT